MNIITNRKNKQTNKKNIVKTEYLEYVRLHLHIQVGYVKQQQSVSEILYVVFKLTYAHTDLLDFM